MENTYDYNNPIESFEFLLENNIKNDRQLFFSFDNRYFKQVYTKGGYYGLLYIYEYKTREDLEDGIGGKVIYGPYPKNTTDEGKFIEYSLRRFRLKIN